MLADKGSAFLGSSLQPECTARAFMTAAGVRGLTHPEILGSANLQSRLNLIFQPFVGIVGGWDIGLVVLYFSSALQPGSRHGHAIPNAFIKSMTLQGNGLEAK